MAGAEGIARIPGEEAASDGKKAIQAKEAAMLCSIAEGHLDDEDPEEALTAASDALRYFREKKEQAGIADTARIMIRCYSMQGKHNEALALGEEELAKFQKAKDRSGEAKMLLAMAETGGKTYDEGLQFANQSAEAFRSQGDAKMEARARLSTVKVNLAHHTAKAEEKAQRGSDTMQAANEALNMCRRNQDKPGEALALHGIGATYAREGNIREAVQAADEALELYADLGQPKQEAFELKSSAEWYLAAGKPLKALHRAEEALEMMQKHGGGKGREASTMSIVVKAYISKGQADKAIKVAKSGLQRFQEAGDQKSEAAAYRTLYSAHTAAGDDDQALLVMEKALEAAQATGDQEMEVFLLGEASVACFKAGDYETAVADAKKEMDLAMEQKNWTIVASALKHLVDAHVANDQVKDAVDIAKDMREALEKAGDAKAEAAACLALSQAHIAGQNYDLAATAAKAAAEAAYQEEDDNLEGLALDMLTDVYMRAEKYEKAARAGEQARRIWKSLEKLANEANALNQVAQAFINQQYKTGSTPAKSTRASRTAGGLEKAIKAGREALALAKEMPVTEGSFTFQANAWIVITQVHLAKGETEDALAAASEAVSLFKQAGDDRGEGYALVLEAQAEIQTEKFDKAKKLANDGMKIFKKHNDATGIAYAQDALDLIEKLAPPPPPPVFVPQAQWGAPGAPMRMPGQPQMPQWDPEAAGAQMVRAPRSGGTGALDMSSLSEDVVVGKVKEVAIGLVGDEDAEELELDTPLMEAGLTSNTAVLLRDELMNDLPGMNLPPTLIFDYPSVQAIADFIQEKAGVQ